MTSGRLLREARRRHGLTQAQLAARARTSQAAISRIERELVSPSVATLATLLDLMGEKLELGARPLTYKVNREVLRDNLDLTPEERIEQGAELGALLRGTARPRAGTPTLHLELARTLRENGNRWLTTNELADLANAAGRYKRQVRGPVTAYQIHGRTKNYPHVFERKGSRVRLADGRETG